MNGNYIRAAAPQPIAVFILTMSLFAIWGLGQRLHDELLPQFGSIIISWSQGWKTSEPNHASDRPLELTYAPAISAFFSELSLFAFI
jgi:hypothetical protein